MNLKKLARKKGALTGLSFIVFLLFMGIFAPFLAAQNPIKQNLSDRFQPPSFHHWFGTDNLGRDIYSRIIYGSRISLTVGFSAVGLAASWGILIGLIAGFYGGWIDLTLMGIMEILMAFPSILLAIAIVSILGPSLPNAILAIGIVYIPLYARLTRAQVLSVKELEYVQAARAEGCSNSRILLVHILPNCSSPLIVQLSLGIGNAILDFAGLSFLGLGAQPPTPDWGSMLSSTVHFLEIAPWAVIFPGILITLTVFSFNLLGDGIRDILDPKMIERKT
jgi:peptide/nickel transport system permease protein